MGGWGVNPGTRLPDIVVIANMGEMTADAMNYLHGVVKERPEGRQMAAGVSAAGLILQHARWMTELEMARSAEATFMAMFPSPQAAANWLAENRDRLAAQLPAPEASSVPRSTVPHSTAEKADEAEQGREAQAHAEQQEDGRPAGQSPRR